MRYNSGTFTAIRIEFERQTVSNSMTKEDEMIDSSTLSIGDFPKWILSRIYMFQDIETNKSNSFELKICHMSKTGTNLNGLPISPWLRVNVVWALDSYAKLLYTFWHIKWDLLNKNRFRQRWVKSRCSLILVKLYVNVNTLRSWFCMGNSSNRRFQLPANNSWGMLNRFSEDGATIRSLYNVLEELKLVENLF